MCRIYVGNLVSHTKRMTQIKGVRNRAHFQPFLVNAPKYSVFIHIDKEFVKNFGFHCYVTIIVTRDMMHLTPHETQNHNKFLHKRNTWRFGGGGKCSLNISYN
jgi:hypothetical protein